MSNKHDFARIHFSVFSARLIEIFSVLLLFTGCGENAGQTQQSDYGNSASLLLVSPLIGDEPTVRNPLPKPTEWAASEELVTGWEAPPEGVLRFPVQLKRNYRLFFRLGIFRNNPATGRPMPPIGGPMPPSPVGQPAPPPPVGQPAPPPPVGQPPPPPPVGQQAAPVALNALEFKVEFTPEGSADPISLYEVGGTDCASALENWMQVDVPLSACPEGNGEIRFTANQQTGGGSGPTIVWGQPALTWPANRPTRNVLLIGVDTLRADAISPYGGRPEVTPCLKTFGETSCVFDRARSQAPFTLPSFASMLTGLWPSEVFKKIETTSIPESNTTIAETLLSKGIATYGTCGFPMLGNPVSGFPQGCEAFSSYMDPRAQAPVESAKAFISRTKDRDWFCFLHVYDPHAPYNPPEQYADLLRDPSYSGAYSRVVNESDFARWATETPPASELQQMRNLYNGEVANVDSAISDLLAFLTDNGLLDNTLVIFTSDHGEEFYEHGGFEHSRTLYDEVVKTALIVRGPGFPQGERVEAPAGNIDIYPTILSYYGLPMEQGLKGIPLQDVAAGKTPDRTIFGEDNLYADPLAYALDWPYKCIFNLATDNYQLFNLEEDPWEQSDLSSSLNDQAQGLIGEIEQALCYRNAVYHLWIVSTDPTRSETCTGTLRVLGGIKDVKSSFLTSEDQYSIDGDTLTFSIKTATEGNHSQSDELAAPGGRPEGYIKHLVIAAQPCMLPNVEVDVQFSQADVISGFYPWGFPSLAPWGVTSVRFANFAPFPVFPPGQASPEAYFLLWATTLRESTEPRAKLGAESIEQLRALGYLGQ